MKIFDAQLRSDTRTDDELRNLAYFDTEYVVTTAHPAQAFEDADSLLAYFRHLIDSELERLRRCGLDGGVALGLLPKTRPRRAHPEVYSELPQLLADERVFAVGEIGAWVDNSSHWELFDRQIRFALDANLPVIVTPPSDLRVNMTYKMMARAQQLGMRPERCMMNLLDARLLETAVEEGFVGGIAVGYRHIEPREAASIVAGVLERVPAALDRIVLNSSLRRGAADILGIPKTVVALGEAGLSPAQIEKLAFENANRLFRTSR